MDLSRQSIFDGRANTLRTTHHGSPWPRVNHMLKETPRLICPEPLMALSFSISFLFFVFFVRSSYLSSISFFFFEEKCVWILILGFLPHHLQCRKIYPQIVCENVSAYVQLTKHLLRNHFSSIIKANIGKTNINLVNPSPRGSPDNIVPRSIPSGAGKHWWLDTDKMLKGFPIGTTAGMLNSNQLCARKGNIYRNWPS